jgi:hypothetical protein
VPAALIETERRIAARRQPDAEKASRGKPVLAEIVAQRGRGLGPYLRK